MDVCIPDGLCDPLGDVALVQQLHGEVLDRHNGAALVDVVIQLLNRRLHLHKAHACSGSCDLDGNIGTAPLQRPILCHAASICHAASLSMEQDNYSTSCTALHGAEI